MQILTRFNKVIAYSNDEYIPVGNTAICAATNERYDDVLITNVDCVPTDIDKYEYHYIDGKFIKGCPNSEIRETNLWNKFRFWVGTSEEYEALSKKDENTLYIITDDDTYQKKIPWTAVDLANYDNEPPSPSQAGVYEVLYKTDTDSVCCGFGSCYYVGNANDIVGLTTMRPACFPVAKHMALEYWVCFQEGKIILQKKDTVNNTDWERVTTGKIYYRKISDLEVV